MVYFLPDELWVKIINLLYIKDAISTSMVNKRFFNLTKYYNTIRYQKLDTVSNLDIVKTDTFIKHLYRVKYFEDLNSIVLLNLMYDVKDLMVQLF